IVAWLELGDADGDLSPGVTAVEIGLDCGATIPHSLRIGAQHRECELVPGDVAMAVVDLFEAVDVQERQGELSVRAPRALDLGAQDALAETTAVGAGEIVEMSAVPSLDQLGAIPCC